MFKKVIVHEHTNSRDFMGKGFSRIFIEPKDEGREGEVLKLLEKFDSEEFDFYFPLEGNQRDNYVTVWKENEPGIELYYTGKFSIERVEEFAQKCKQELGMNVLIKFSPRTGDEECFEKYV
jgi:hypothetical protein